MSYNEFSFKNSGNFKKDTINYKNLSENKFQEFPVGISLPLRKGSKSNESLFAMNFDVENQIKDNLKLLLTCKKNEVIRNPNFGTNLSILFNSTNLSNEELSDLARQEISSSVNQYMNPSFINGKRYFLSLESFSIDRDSNNNLENFYILQVEYKISGYSFEDLQVIKKVNNTDNVDYLSSKINNIIIKFRTSN
jgi:hypothetical protein